VDIVFIAIAPRKRITFDWTQPMPVPAPLTLSISAKVDSPPKNPTDLESKGKDRPELIQVKELPFALNRMF
jgi:hypothetical protein